VLRAILSKRSNGLLEANTTVDIDINSAGSNPYHEINLFGKGSGMEFLVKKDYFGDIRGSEDTRSIKIADPYWGVVKG
jgi:hypothetical protein